MPAANAVTGTLNAAKTVWRSRWALGVSRPYRVTATAIGPDGRRVTRHRAFRTLTPARTFAPRTILINNGTYGVGMPLIFFFDEPVTNRKAVERSLEIRTSRRVVGSWYLGRLVRHRAAVSVLPAAAVLAPAHARVASPRT